MLGKVADMATIFTAVALSASRGSASPCEDAAGENNPSPPGLAPGIAPGVAPGVAPGAPSAGLPPSGLEVSWVSIASSAFAPARAPGPGPAIDPGPDPAPAPAIAPAIGIGIGIGIIASTLMTASACQSRTS